MLSKSRFPEREGRNEGECKNVVHPRENNRRQGLMVEPGAGFGLHLFIGRTNLPDRDFGWGAPSDLHGGILQGRAAIGGPPRKASLHEKLKSASFFIFRD